jgi:hypothetical protein
MEKIIVTLWITFGIYLMVLLAIMADLWSGVRKAKKNDNDSTKQKPPTLPPVEPPTVPPLKP